METLTVEKAHELLKRAVAEKGADYVYRYITDDPEVDCLYFVEGQPSCIVGHVLHYLGAPPSEVSEGMAADTILAVLDLADSNSVVAHALRAAQETQDAGGAWGEALAAFDAEVELVSA